MSGDIFADKFPVFCGDTVLSPNIRPNFSEINPLITLEKNF